MFLLAKIRGWRYLLLSCLTFRVTASLVIQGPSNQASPTSVSYETTTVDGTFPICWRPHASYTPIPLYIEDCLDSLRIVLDLPLPDLPRIFSPNTYQDIDGGYKISLWAAEDCFIYVNSLKLHMIDQLSFADIWRRAKGIIELCVEPQMWGFGGWESIGLAASGFYVGIGAVPPHTHGFAAVSKPVVLNGTRGVANSIVQTSRHRN